MCGLVVIAILTGKIATALTDFGYTGPYIPLYGADVSIKGASFIGYKTLLKTFYQMEQRFRGISFKPRQTLQKALGDTEI